MTPTIELRKPLGAGGMGHVSIAWHAGLHTEVVVKLIAADLAQDPAMVARFSREAAAAAQVRSPHVVQIFDHGVTATGHPYIAMERLEGESLRERLDRTGVVPPRELAVIVGQCARALARAHERGVVHRDIKPDNVFLTDLGADEPFVKVLDFGIAKTEAGPSSATTTGAVLGSPFYMSPEQILGKKDVDFHTDLWSLGVLTYEALLGVRPFAGETIGALSISICREPLPMPSSQRAGVPPSVDEWFARACARANRASASRRWGAGRPAQGRVRRGTGDARPRDQPARLRANGAAGLDDRCCREPAASTAEQRAAGGGARCRGRPGLRRRARRVRTAQPAEPRGGLVSEGLLRGRVDAISIRLVVDDHPGAPCCEHRASEHNQALARHRSEEEEPSHPEWHAVHLRQREPLCERASLQASRNGCGS
ncbi:MAG: serine/threonine protein kinase [Myxococcales bacterium]|nr:serine/threonine protein kinase [Myxococcales bacterium]